MELSFIVIDDTELDHFIARKVITNANKAFQVKSFLDASQALTYIRDNDHDDELKIIIVFLDIYMPIMNGFQFVEEFEKLPAQLQNKFYIVALTSSIEIYDINRVNSYETFRAHITKPLTAESLAPLLISLANELGMK